MWQGYLPPKPAKGALPCVSRRMELLAVAGVFGGGGRGFPVSALAVRASPRVCDFLQGPQSYWMKVRPDFSMTSP